MKPAAAAFSAAAGSGAVPDHLATARLTLRPLRQADAPDLHRFFSDPIAMRHFGAVHHDLAESEDWVRRTLAAPPERTREYAILRAGRVIGKAGIWSAPELGYFLQRSHWGQGLMHEALTALLPRLFADLSLPRITADVDPRNPASARVLERLGFNETGRARNTIQIAGEWTDSVYYALDAPV